MENATQALLIAAGVLIGVMILTLGVTLFAELSSYVETSHNEIRFNELNSFNTQFLKYQGTDENPIYLTIHDVITVANLANENNSSYNLTDESSRGIDSVYYVAVYLDGTPIEFEIRDENKLVDYLSDSLINDKSFICSGINISEKTGRVFEVYFEEI